MNIISASLVNRFADVLDFSDAIMNTTKKLSERQEQAMLDQFDRLFHRFERIRPADIDEKALNERARKELERRKIATAREMERRAARNAKKREVEILDKHMKEGLAAIAF